MHVLFGSWQESWVCLLKSQQFPKGISKLSSLVLALNQGKFPNTLLRPWSQCIEAPSDGLVQGKHPKPSQALLIPCPQPAQSTLSSQICEVSHQGRSLASHGSQEDSLLGMAMQDGAGLCFKSYMAISDSILRFAILSACAIYRHKSTSTKLPMHAHFKSWTTFLMRLMMARTCMAKKKRLQ